MGLTILVSNLNLHCKYTAFIYICQGIKKAGHVSDVACF
jgi:hypothetical protein